MTHTPSPPLTRYTLVDIQAGDAVNVRGNIINLNGAMRMPAARRGDMTVHGGTITTGHPTVRIGGELAASVGDVHVCPMVTGTAPHGGGPVVMGCPTVRIGGQPAARVGDVVTCNGPPDAISTGCNTVLIGVSGGEATAATGAQTSAHAA